MWIFRRRWSERSRCWTYAVLVINGADGIQGHTATLWKLLDRYRIPAFLFVNKMDQEGTDRAGLLEKLRKEFCDRLRGFRGRSGIGGNGRKAWRFVMKR